MEAEIIEEETTIAPGIYEIPEKEYHAGPGISKSALNYMEQSPAHYHWYKNNPGPTTAAMEFGSLFHPYVLEPEKFNDKIAYGPDKERRKKEDRAEWAEWWNSNIDRVKLDANGHILTMNKTGSVTRDSDLNMELAKAMKYQLDKHPIAMQALSGEGRAEQSLYSVDEETGILKRCRIDWIPNEGNTLSDLKTTADASPEGFAKSVFNFNYHVQAAYYLDIANELGLDRNVFCFVVIEKTPPYPVAVYKLDRDTIEMGRQKYRRWLQMLEKCTLEDKWPGYPEKVMDIVPPRWVK